MPVLGPAAKAPTAVGTGAAKAGRAAAALMRHSPMAVASLIAGVVSLVLAYAAYERGSSIPGLLIVAAGITITWVLSTVTKRRAKRLGRRPPWSVPVSRLLALGAVVLLGLAGYGVARGILPDVALPPLPPLG